MCWIERCGLRTSAHNFGYVLTAEFAEIAEWLDCWPPSGPKDLQPTAKIFSVVSAYSAVKYVIELVTALTKDAATPPPRRRH
jgi:hypothetical protein